MGSSVEDREYEELKRWARTADLPEPVRWGEVEDVILKYPPPPRDQMSPLLKKNDRARSVAGYLIMLPVIAGVFGAPFIVLGSVIAHVVYGWSVPRDSWMSVFLSIELIAAIVVPAFPALVWWTTKRRERWHLPLCGMATVASFVSFWLVWTGSGDEWWSGFTTWSLSAVVVGCVTFVLTLVMAEPGIRRPWRESWREVPPEEKWYRGSRAGVLGQLEKRGLVSGADITDMVAMPLRTWHELDENPPRAWVRAGR